jgi:hypothetical protein
VITRFVDNSEIDDHHCLNLLGVQGGRVRVLEIHVLSCNRHKYEEILGFHPSPLDNWIFNGNINTTCYQQNE